MRARNLLLGVLVVLWGLGYFHGPVERPRDRQLTILHTNDLHGQIQPFLLRKVDAAGKPTDEFELRGGVAALAGRIRAERAAAAAEGRTLFLLDAGDLWQGTPEAELTGGRAVWTYYNALRHDALVAGNHEFDKGVDFFLKFMSELDTNLLAANIIADERRALFWPERLSAYRILERDHVRLAVVGLTSSATKAMTVGGATDGLSFIDELATLQHFLPRIAAEQPHVTVLLTHIGVDEDRHLARHLTGVDAIVGGHSHTALERAEADPETGVWIVQAGCKGAYLGRLDITLDGRNGHVKARRARLIPIAPGEGEDPEMAAEMKRLTEPIERQMAQKLATTAKPLMREPVVEEFALGTLVAQAMREASGADIAIQNRTGVRADIVGPDITLRDMWQVCPFGNHIVTMKMKGKDLKAILEYSLSGGRARLDIALPQQGDGVHYDPPAPLGQRLRQVVIGGAAVEDDKVYTLATNSYLASVKTSAGGFDSAQGRNKPRLTTAEREFKGFQAGTEVQNLSKLVRDALRERVVKDQRLEGPRDDYYRPQER